MPYAVVEIHTDSIRGLSVRVFAPHDTVDEAEKDRRRRHLDRAIDEPRTVNDPRRGYRYVIAPMVTP
jgi:hypothetical protein